MALKKNTKSIFMAIGAGLACASIFVIANGSQSTNAPVAKQEFQYVYTVGEIKKGDKIKEENITFKAAPVEIDNAIKNSGEVIGRKAKQNLSDGMLLTKDLLEEIKVDDTPELDASNIQPGFRAFPVLVETKTLPPFVTAGKKFDIYTRENTLEIDNVKILTILNQPGANNQKILVLEIKNSDIKTLLKQITSGNMFIFVEKSPEEYGEYKFINLEKTAQSIGGSSVGPSMGEYIPPIKNLDMNIGESSYMPDMDMSTKPAGKEVEVIVGNKKTKMEFEE